MGFQNNQIDGLDYWGIELPGSVYESLGGQAAMQLQSTLADYFSRLYRLAKNASPAKQSSASTTSVLEDQVDTVLMRNDSGTDRPRFDVLGISGPISTPTADQEDFLDQLALIGVTPTAAHVGKFAVLLEPIKAGEIGIVCVEGVTCARLWVTAETDGFSDVSVDNTYKLTTGAAGSARILWKEAGVTTDAASMKWGIVRLGENVAGTVDILALLGTEIGEGEYEWLEQTISAAGTIIDAPVPARSNETHGTARDLNDTSGCTGCIVRLFPIVGVDGKVWYRFDSVGMGAKPQVFNMLHEGGRGWSLWRFAP